MKGVRLFVGLVSATAVVAYLVFAFAPSRRMPAAGDAVVAKALGDLIVGEPVVLGNLAIFPVSSPTPLLDDRFITLDEGLKAGTVEIYEKGATHLPDAEAANGTTAPVDPFAEPTALPVGDVPVQILSGNDVNELMVINRSEKPLYLMPGEVIIGGDQDRTIGEELVIAADCKPVAIPVFCVEHGRWGDRDQQGYADVLALATANEESLASAIAVSQHSSLSLTVEDAKSGKFVGSVGSLNKPGRLAVQRDGQVEVWEHVAGERAKAGIQSSTGTFTACIADARSLERLEPFIKRFQRPITETRDVVGVVVAVNGEVESLDVFHSTPLFQKLWPKLLKSYALDAANAEDQETVQGQATRRAAIAFLNEVRQAEVQTANADGDLERSASETERVLVFSAHERRTSDIGGPAAIGGMGGYGGSFGGAIHSAGFSK
jgi:hypothetical protein